MNFRSKAFFVTMLLSLGVSLNAYAQSVPNLPQGGTFVAGSSTIDQSQPDKEIINTNTPKSIVNFPGGFDIGANDTTVIN